MRGLEAKPHFQDRPDLAPVPELPAVMPWKRSMRRLRARGVFDPFVQSVIALTLAVALGGSGAVLAAHHQLVIAAPALLIAVTLAAVYWSLVTDALRRDKTIQYWHERRELERKLVRERAHRTVLAATLDRIRELDDAGEPGRSAPQAQAVLAGLVTDVFEALSSGYDDIAVVLSYEADNRRWILHSAHGRGSRWNELKAGKQCSTKVPVEETLSRLAAHHRTVEAQVAPGRLRFSVLSDLPLHERDRELVEQIPACLELIARRWTPTPTARRSEARPWARSHGRPRR